MYNPVAVFLWGAACGAATVLFALLAVWMHAKDAALEEDERARNADLVGKGMVWAGLMSLALVVVALVAALDSTFGLPHLAWPAGVLTGVGVMLGFRFMVRRGKTESHRRN
jgi:hypothetical protein